MITIKSFDGGEFGAYVALPASGYGPGIVVLQEIFGVRPFLSAAANAPSLSDLFKPTLKLSLPAFTSNKSFSFTLTGIPAGKTNYFQFSPNFTNWSDLLTNVVSTNTFNFSDRSASNSPRRFYRVIETP